MRAGGGWRLVLSQAGPSPRRPLLLAGLRLLGLALRGAGGGGARGEGVKLRRPHLGAIGAFLPAERMFADGSGQDRVGGAGRVVRTGRQADGNPDASRRSRRQPGPAGGKEAGEALPGAVRAPFPCAGPQGRSSHRPSLFYLIKAEDKAGERQSDTPILDLAVQPM